jgi:hypothetical protein
LSGAVTVGWIGDGSSGDGVGVSGVTHGCG